MKNKSIYMGLTFVLLLAVIFIFVIRPLSSNHSGSTSLAQDNGDYQKVVLSLKSGNYYPSTIEVQSGKPVRIYMDNSVQGCYRTLVVRDFGISKSFSSNSDYVEFTPNTQGTYAFSCAMGMGRGQIKVN